MSPAYTKLTFHIFGPKGKFIPYNILLCLGYFLGLLLDLLIDLRTSQRLGSKAIIIPLGHGNNYSDFDGISLSEVYPSRYNNCQKCN